MKKAFLAVGIFTLIALIVILSGITKTSDELSKASLLDSKDDSVFLQAGTEIISIDKSLSKIEFEGYSIGKSHLGAFKEFDGAIYSKDNKITGIDGTIQSSSLSTGINRLDNSLRSKDFLNPEKYPEIKFKSKKIENNEMTGVLTFLGVANEITFPVDLSENSISADFIIDTKPFGLNNPLANTEVRIAFEFRK